MVLKIIGIKTNKGYYIANSYDEENKNWSSNPTGLKKYLINGLKPEETFNKIWSFTKKEPETVQEYKSQPNINKRYELKDKDLVSDKIPEIIQYNEVETDDDCYCTNWTGKYAPYQSLYEFKSDEQLDKLVDTEFEYKTIIELDIEEIEAPEKFNYIAHISNWDNEKDKITNKNLKHDRIDEILVPSLLIHQKPCILKSREVYGILREYIKTHINGKYARISSDYNFCFEVQKVTPGVNNRKTIFEMTHKQENYKDYTPIDDLVADTEKELKNKIDKLCKDTIKKINEPLIICPECRGYGTILKEED